MTPRDEDEDGLRCGLTFVLPNQTLPRWCWPMIRRIGFFLALLVAAMSEPAGAGDIIDQRGRSIAFEKLPQRTVFLPIPGPATFIAIDGSERKIAGMNGYSASAMREGLLGKMFPGFAKIPTNVVTGAADPSNFNPNVESILALRPDAVFQWATSAIDVSNAPACLYSACVPARKKTSLASSPCWVRLPATNRAPQPCWRGKRGKAQD